MLMVGAAGGVGSFALQLAAQAGGHVIAVARADAGGFATLAALVRSGGTALTTRYFADTEALASRGVAGVNFRVSMSSEALERLADLVVNGTIVVPPITLIELVDVPTLNPDAHTDGKTVITP